MQPTISSLLGAAEQGDAAAAEALFTALYSELHRLARRELARQGVPVSLSPTTLLHEAYLEMAAHDGPLFPDRARFMSYSGRKGDFTSALANYYAPSIPWLLTADATFGLALSHEERSLPAN
jgi:hypothetical protein